ncbi:MAG: MFS transporter, partial [Acidimicrobiia bacterium]|nr:MFS transporter [Acidimicrobiia bacterium]
MLLLPGFRRRLRESRRFVRVAARGATGRARELVDRTYGGRFALVVATAFLTNAFVAASSQLTNPFLQDERGYSAFGILALRAVAQGPIVLVAVWIGGRLAESAGRRPLVIWGTFCATVLAALFFLVGGSWMWLALLGATLAGALATPAFGAMGGELFPTEVR